MITGIEVAPADALNRLQDALGQYQRVRGQAPAKVLLRAGRNLSIQLYRAFDAEAAEEGEITFRAWMRNWRVGRNDPAEGDPENTGFSQAALDRARRRMGGHASILAQVVVEENRIRLRGVRVAKRNLNRRISGGRRNDSGYAVAGTNKALRQAGDKRLNFRAVATIEELNVREGGRRFLAVSWLHRRWNYLAQTDPRRMAGVHRTLVNRNPRSKLGWLGKAELRAAPTNTEHTFAITSMVPGVAEVGRGRGIFARAIRAVADDMSSFALAEESRQLVNILTGRAA